MRAAVFRQGDIVVDTLPDPKPGHGQVLVKTLACGICGSDLHARLHAPKMAALSARLPGREPMDISQDIVFGHEYCCEILDYGPGTAKTLKAGTHVCSVPRLIVDGAVRGIGYSNSNVGGYAERMLLSEPLLVPVPNGLSPARAALTEPLAVGVHAVEKARVQGDEAPLVIGCGPVGLAVIAALKLKRTAMPGLGSIIAADYSPKRRELAVKMGADIVVDPAKTSPYTTWGQHAALPAVKDAGKGLAAGLIDVKPAFKQALIFECVGVPGVIQQCIQLCEPRGTVLIAGVCMKPDTLIPVIAVLKELRLQFVAYYHRRNFELTLDLLGSERIRADRFVTDVIALDALPAAFEALKQPSTQCKVIVKP